MCMEMFQECAEQNVYLENKYLHLNFNSAVFGNSKISNWCPY